MNRRSFLSTILALGVAPAIVRADSLMRIVPLRTTIISSWADGALLDVETDAVGLTYGSVTLSAIVDDLLQRSGLKPYMYDVSALARDNVRGLGVVAEASLSSVVGLLQRSYFFDLQISNGMIIATKRAA